MSAIFNLAYIVALSTLIYVFGTALLSRTTLAKKVNIYFRIAGLGFISLPAIWALRHAISADFSSYAPIDGILHLSLGALFAQFICLPDRALTLRLLVEMYDSGNQGLSLKELNMRFSLSRMIESRLIQMDRGSVLKIEDSRAITLTSKGRRIGNFVIAGRKFFNIGSAN